MGSKGGSKTTQTAKAEPWSAAQPLLKNLIGDTTRMYQAGGLDIPPWPGARVAPQSNLTQAGLQGYWDIGTGGNPITGPATAAFGDIVGGQNIYNNLGAVREQALAGAMPAALAPFEASGMLDSTFAADAAGRAAAGALAPIEYGAWENAQNRRLSALGMAPQLAANQYLDAQMLGMAGQQQDAYTQNLLNAAMQSYGDAANRGYDELQRAAGLGMGFGGLGSTSTAQAKEGQSGSTMGTIGGIMQTVLPIVAMFAMGSDKRLKKDITRVGKTDDGLPLYLYRYKGESDLAPGRLGLMAQDVEKKKPEAVFEMPDGHKGVNYAMAFA